MSNDPTPTPSKASTRYQIFGKQTGLRVSDLALGTGRFGQRVAGGKLDLMDFPSRPLL